MTNPLILFIFFCILLASCSPSKKRVTIATPPTEAPRKPPAVPEIKVATQNPNNAYLLALLKKYPRWFSQITEDSASSNIQVYFTEISRNAANAPVAKTYSYNGSESIYFYPATVVGLPIAILALQKVQELAPRGITVNTTMITERSSSSQTATYNDPFTPNGKPTVGGYIKRMLLYEDEEAFNRLYEFLGQQYINDALHKTGFAEVQILERLGLFLNEKENAATNPVKFLDDRGNLMYTQPMLINSQTYPKRNDYVGTSYYSNGTLYKNPMMFSYKNKIALSSLQALMQMLALPSLFGSNRQLVLSEQHRNLLLGYMSGNTVLNAQSNYPPHRPQPLTNALKEKFPQHMINVIELGGKGYGQVTQLAYVSDATTGIEYFVSATILANSKTVLNSGKYEYNEKAYPFLKNLIIAMHEQGIKANGK